MRTSMRNRLAAALALLCIVAAATQGTGTADSKTGPQPETAPMTLERLATRRIPGVCDFPAAVYVNSVHPDSPGPDSSVAQVVRSKLGDLNGNGIDDGVIDVMCTYGGNGIVFNLFAYRANGGRFGERIPVERFAVNYGPFPPQYDRVQIVDNEIRTVVHTWRSTDAHCCPSIVTRLHLRWNGRTFVRV